VNDFELVAAAKTGDQAAFAELHRRHIDAVQAVCQKILGVDDVDDVCQEIFQKAFTRIDSFERKAEAEFKTWLISIVRRECFRIKKDRMRPTKGSFYLDPLVGLDEYGEEQEVQHDPGWKAGFDDAEKRMDLSKIIPSLDSILPPKSQRVVKAALGGATMQQIATILGVPLKTAESRFTRLLRRIEKNVSPK
jgi:RNA polymerase sigma factor (sigma-70 family)